MEIIFYTHMIQSIANRSDTLLASKSTAPSTTNNITTEADGIVGIAIESAVDVMRIMNNESSPRATPFNWAMKQADMHIYSDVPAIKKNAKKNRLDH